MLGIVANTGQYIASSILGTVDNTDQYRARSMLGTVANTSQYISSAMLYWPVYILLYAGNSGEY